MKTSMAAADWSYGYGQVLTVGGDGFTPESVPEDRAEAWIESEAAEELEEEATSPDELLAENETLRARLAELEAREAKRETATRQPPETTAHPPAGPNTAAPAKEEPTKADRPANDREALPPGYESSHKGGGYYELTGPDGAVPGKSNGSHQGKDVAADAAWADYLKAE